VSIVALLFTTIVAYAVLLLLPSKLAPNRA